MRMLSASFVFDAIVGMLLLVGACLIANACKGDDVARTVRVADTVTAPFDVPVVSDPALHSWMESAARRFDEIAAENRRLRDEAIAAGKKPPSENMTLGQWIAGLTGVGSAAGAFAMARRSAAAKDAEQEQNRNATRSEQLTNLATGVAKALLAAQRGAPDATKIAEILSDALPGAAEVDPRRVESVVTAPAA